MSGVFAEITEFVNDPPIGAAYIWPIKVLKTQAIAPLTISKAFHFPKIDESFIIYFEQLYNLFFLILVISRKGVP